MALDSKYFDSIHIEVVKKKYYNANKVEAVFADIRQQAQALTEENEALRRQLQGQADQKSELAEAACSAQEVYRLIVGKANERAAAILAEAEELRQSARMETQRQSDYSVQLVERCLKQLREQQQASLDTINAAWQSFLCGLYPEPEEFRVESAAPDDLSEKVDAIARELFAMEE